MKEKEQLSCQLVTTHCGICNLFPGAAMVVSDAGRRTVYMSQARGNTRKGGVYSAQRHEALSDHPRGTMSTQQRHYQPTTPSQHML